MAPQVVEAAAGAAAKEYKKESATARLLGSGKPVTHFHQKGLRLTKEIQVPLESLNLPSSILYGDEIASSMATTLTSPRWTPLRNG